MAVKEEKFWELYREKGELFGKLADLVAEAAKAPVSMESYKDMGELLRRRPFAESRLVEKMYKAYKDPYGEHEASCLLSQSGDILRNGYDLIRLSYAAGPAHVSKAVSDMALLAAEGLREWQKLAMYTSDRKTNALRIEARTERLLAYEERSQAVMLEGLHEIYRGPSEACTAEKEILFLLETILRLTTQNALCLRHILEE